MNKTQLTRNLIISIFILVGFYFLSNYVINTLNIFLSFTNYLLSLQFAFILYYFLFKKNFNMVFIFYMMMLIVYMYFRRDVAIIDKAYSFEFYLFKWLRLLNNSIVFINLIGNLILFIPLVLYLSYLWNKSYIYNFVITILIIIFLEWLQAFTKKGIFDIVDIVLNIVGVLLAVLIKFICKGVIKWNKSQTNRRNDLTKKKISKS